DCQSLSRIAEVVFEVVSSIRSYQTGRMHDYVFDGEFFCPRCERWAHRFPNLGPLITPDSGISSSDFVIHFFLPPMAASVVGSIQYGFGDQSKSGFVKCASRRMEEDTVTPLHTY